jgi:hypothetical protein
MIAPEFMRGLAACTVAAASLLAGCVASPAPEDGGTVAAVNPYPPGAETPFFRSASQWIDGGEKK